MTFNWKSPKTWVTVKGHCIKQKDNDKILLLLQPIDPFGDFFVEADRSSASRLGLKIGSEVAMQWFYDYPEIEGAMAARFQKDFPLDKIKVVLMNRKCSVEAKILWWNK